jgi:hypothetical protein
MPRSTWGDIIAPGGAVGKGPGADDPCAVADRRGGCVQEGSQEEAAG